jgi:hypothetical protein
MVTLPVRPQMYRKPALVNRTSVDVTSM